MRIPLFTLLLTLPLAAGSGLRVVAVERVGWPPFEDDRRIYRLEGEEAPRLRPGEVLQLFRPGDPRNPGRLKVASLEGGRVSAHLESRGTTYPLVGDQAISRRAAPLPALPARTGMPDLSLRPPKGLPPADSSLRPAVQSVVAEPAVPRAAQPSTQQESIYFLEGDGSLSPKGRDKLQQSVRAWGTAGQWILAVPQDRVLPEKVRQSRIEAIRKVMGALGVGKIEIREVQRRDGDTGDVVYLEKA
jgi:hypothetical protein